MDTLGIVTLTVTVAGCTSRQPFVVVQELGTDAILGCTFLDSAVESIHPRKRYALLRNGSRARLVRQLALRPRKERRPVCHRVSRPKDLIILGVAQRAVLAPNSETVALVNTGKRGPVLLEAADEIYRRKKVTLANGVAQVKRSLAFPVRVANLLSKEVVLQNHEKIGTAVPLSMAANVDMVNNQTDQNADQNDGDTVSDTDLDNLELDHLSADLQTRVSEFLAPFSELWSGQLGTVRLTEHPINLKPDSEPVFSQPYRAGPKAQDIEQEEVSKMLPAGVIEPATTESTSPMVLVPKTDGTLRFCFDYRKLNALTVKYSYPLPRIVECLDTLGDAAIFSTLDCNRGYWQIPVAEADTDKTTFTCHEGYYRFKRMPFGLCNAPATFQGTLNILLAGLRWKSCLVYLDDIFVFSRSIEDHFKHLGEIFAILKEAGLSLKLRKCKFFTKTVDYFGLGRCHTAR